MDIVLRAAFDELFLVRVLNALAEWNAEILRMVPASKLPNLYDSGVIYQREPFELWSDVIHTLRAGHEDCDALSAWRAGELMGRGWRALSPADGGYADAVQLRPEHIEAEVMLRTRSEPVQPGLYHCIVRYRVGNHWYRDDPSTRLGMHQGERRPNPWGARPEPIHPNRVEAAA